MRAAVRRREAVAAPDEPRGELNTAQQRGGDQPEPEGDVRQHPAPPGDERRGDGARAMAAPHGLPSRPRFRPRHSVHRQKPGTGKSSHLFSDRRIKQKISVTFTFLFSTDHESYESLTTTMTMDMIT